nr:diguanylate cyclase [Streptomyces lonarensis]
MRQAVLAAVCAAYAVGAALGWGSEELALIMGDFGLSAAALLASGSCLWYARTRAGEFRAAWVLFGLSSLMVGLGNAVWGWYEVVLGEPVPRTSVADLCFLLFAPLAIVGLLMLAKRPVSRAGWLCLGLDASLIAGSLLALSWSVALTHTAQSQGETVIRAALALAYPLLDIVLVTMVLVLHFRRTAAHRAAVNTALGALSLTVLCDALFTSPLLRDQYSSGQLLDAGWFAGSLLLACAPWTPGAGPTTEEQRPGTAAPETEPGGEAPERAEPPQGGRPTEAAARHAPEPPLAQPLSGPLAAMTPYLAAAVCTLSILITVTKGRAVDPVVVGTACAVVLALLVRQGITLRDNIILAGELAQQESHFRSLVQGSSDVIMIAAPDGVLRYVSPAAAGVYGLPAEELVGRRLSDLIHADDLGRVEFELRRFLSVPPAREPVTRVECRVLHGGGRWLNVESSVNRHHSGLIFNSRDVTERVRLQAQLQHSASHDALTDLPNRALFTERLRQAIEGRRTGEGTPAVFYIDLDGFKAVNDTAGHQAGDELLIQAARRLRDSVRSGDTTARLGGDEFAALLSPCPAGASGEPGTPEGGPAAGEDCHAGGEPCRSGQVRSDQVLDIAERVRSALSLPYLVEGREVRVAASIGIAFATPGCSPSGLLREADVAMYRAKQAGKGRVELYAPDVHGQDAVPPVPAAPVGGSHHAARARSPRGVARTGAAAAPGEDVPADRTRPPGGPCPLIPAARSSENYPPALRLTHQPQVSLEDGTVQGLALRLIRSAAGDRTAPGPAPSRAARPGAARDPAAVARTESPDDPRSAQVSRAPSSAPDVVPAPAEPGTGRRPPAVLPGRATRSSGPARAVPPVRWLAVRSARIGGRGPGPRGTETAPRAPGPAESQQEWSAPPVAGPPPSGPRPRAALPPHRPGSVLVDLAAAGAAERLRRGHDLPVTVPLSPEALLGATVSAETVAAVLARHTLPARYLTLALTEAGPLLDDVDYRLSLGRLRALGVGVSLPGLGDGAVPLSALQRLPITEMVLARTLVAGLPDSARARATATALLALAGELGVTVLADGVDHPDQAAVLRSLGCRRGQGAALGGPLDEVALAAALRAGALGQPPRGPAAPGPPGRLRQAPTP